MLITDEVIKAVEEMISSDNNNQMKMASHITEVEPKYNQWVIHQSKMMSAPYDPKIQPYIMNMIISSLYIGYIMAETASNTEYVNVIIKKEETASDIYQKWLSGHMDDKFYETCEVTADFGPDWNVALQNHKLFIAEKEASEAKTKLDNYLANKVGEIEI